MLHQVVALLDEGRLSAPPAPLACRTGGGEHERPAGGGLSPDGFPHENGVGGEGVLVAEVGDRLLNLLATLACIQQSGRKRTQQSTAWHGAAWHSTADMVPDETR